VWRQGWECRQSGELWEECCESVMSLRLGSSWRATSAAGGDQWTGISKWSSRKNNLELKNYKLPLSRSMPPFWNPTNQPLEVILSSLPSPWAKSHQMESRSIQSRSILFPNLSKLLMKSRKDRPKIRTQIKPVKRWMLWENSSKLNLSISRCWNPNRS
jgi:hypothetical protein